MKRSAHVAAPLLASTALALLSGCHQPEMQRCVDENNKVVDDKLCAGQPNAQTLQQSQQQGGHSGVGILPFIPLYHYYYGGYGGRGIGSVVGGGSTAPLAGHSYSSTTRGGFGRSFSSGGAHAGEGEGGHGAGSGE